MKDTDIEVFIEEMEHIGDIWTPEEVKRAYGKSSLNEALEERKAQVECFLDIIGKFF